MSGALRSFNIVESAKNVESVLNQIEISLNFYSTSIQHFLSSRKCRMPLKPFGGILITVFNICLTSVQLLLKACWSNVETV